MIWNFVQKTIFLFCGLAVWTPLLFSWTLDLHAFEERPGLIETSKGWYHWIELPTPSGILIKTIQLIQPKPAQAEELPLKEQIANFIHAIATKYRLDAKILGNLADCESKWKKDPYKAIKAQGDYQSETDTYLANGLFQWHWRSWMKYSIIYPQKIWDYDFWKDQTELSAIVIKNGGINNWWNCAHFVGYYDKK